MTRSGTVGRNMTIDDLYDCYHSDWDCGWILCLKDMSEDLVLDLSRQWLLVLIIGELEKYTGIH